MTTEQPAGFGGMWTRPEDDPRSSQAPAGELPTLRDYLVNYRHTLRLKCADLSPEQLAARSVPPSSMSLLGLVRHMAKVEHVWFQVALRGDTVTPRPYWSADVADVDFDGAVADKAVAEDAFATWAAVIEGSDRVLDGLTDLGATVPYKEQQLSVRDILIHVIEEYARHCGHADLLRECIDGRTGL